MSRKRTLSDLLRDTGLGPSSPAHLARAVAKMGVRYPSVFSNTFIGPLPAGAAETVVLTTPPLTLPLDGAAVFIIWCANILTGATTTFLNFNIRRGTTTAGTVIHLQSFAVPVTAGSKAQGAGCYFDTPGAVAGQQYTLTVSQQAATAAGTWEDGALLAFAL